jgi:hypothetical protein
VASTNLGSQCRENGPEPDAVDPRRDQRSVTEVSIVRVGRAERIHHDRLDIGREDPCDCSSLAPAALSEDAGDVVAIADAALLGRARGIRLPRSSKIRPIRRAPARPILDPLRLAASFSWTASRAGRSPVTSRSNWAKGNSMLR